METIKSYKLSYITSLNPIDIPLSSSKSESNRVLILNALSRPQATIENLSDARDTQTMQRLLKSTDQELDVLDAGTTMRFLTAYHAISQENVVLTGTARMQERPIKILVEALNLLGADIQYQKKEGYPPIKLNSFSGQVTNELTVRGDISSQYISALLMIGPKLPNGLKLIMEGKIMSKPYIEMTLALMEHYGVNYQWKDQTIQLSPQIYKASDYTVESDWSGASYWYSLVALAKEAKIKLLNLRKHSLQGDSKIVEIMEQLGVATTFESDGVLLQKKDHVTSLSIDFSHCPDLAQTVAVTCAAKGIICKMAGLKSLRIKETDRIAALQSELSKFGAKFIEHNENSWELIPADTLHLPAQLSIHTYEDHRMAMAFAPLAGIGNVTIQDPDVVQKSYPTFWEHLKLAGIGII